MKNTKTPPSPVIPANPITPAEAARRLGFRSVSRVYALIREGRIAAVPWGRSYLVDPDGLDYAPKPVGRPPGSGVVAGPVPDPVATTPASTKPSVRSGKGQ